MQREFGLLFNLLLCHILLNFPIIKCSYYDGDDGTLNQHFLNTCEEEGFHSDPLDCRIFYRCINWGNSKPLTSFKFQCGFGTVFSKSMGNVCVTPGKSERTECAEMENDINFDSQEDSVANSFARLNALDNSEKYLPIMIDDPSHYNNLKLVGLFNNPTFLSNENSILGSEMYSQAFDNTLVKETLDDCSDEGFFADLRDCHKFYRCVLDEFGFRKFTFHCAPGTAWDQQQQTCNYVSQVLTCHFGDNTHTQSNFPNLGANVVSSNLYPVKNTANMDINVYNSTKVIASGYLPPAASNAHDESQTSDSSDSNSNDVALSAEPCSSNCDQNDDVVCNIDGFYAHPTKCNKFYRCVDNGNGFNVYHFDCPPGTIFDPSINVCNYPKSIYPPRKCITSDGPASDKPPSSSTVKTQELTTMPYITEHTTLNMENNSLELTTNVEKNDFSTEKPDSSTTETSSETTLQNFDTSMTTGMVSMTSTMQSVTMKEDATLMTTAVSTLTDSTTITEINLETTTTTKSNVEVSTSIMESSTKDEQESGTTIMSSTQKDFSNCPIASNFTDEQVLLLCPTGFKRHPKFCNIIYQCTTQDNSQINFLTLRCPENTIFDETKIQCVSESESSQPCEGSINRDRINRQSVNNNRLLSIKLSSQSICPDEGYYPFQSECSIAFFKCQRNTRSLMQGYLYKCPVGFVYWTVSKRCERVSWLKTCTSSRYEEETIFWGKRWEVPTIEKDNFYT